MKRLLWTALILLLAGCSADMSAKEPYPVEKDYPFNERLVQEVPNNITLKTYPSSNEFKINFVTTYEQAAFLKRNESYITFETIGNNFKLPKASLVIGERFEIEDLVYYAMKIHVRATKAELEGIPQSFSQLEVKLEGVPLMTLNIGNVSFSEEATRYSEDVPAEELKKAALLLHEGQK